MFVLYSILCLSFPYLVWSLVQLATNYARAKKIGLPILITPVNPSGPLWMSTQKVLRPILVRLPFGLGEWATRADMGWTYYLKFQIHAKYGEAFIIVSPSENEIVLAEPTAAEDVMRRRNDFIKNPAMYGMLDIYGPNLDTVNGKVWDRHRKITVPPFNEHNSALVWRETGEQADQMLDIWCSREDVRSTQLDVHAVALNVLCGAGFGVHSSFVDERKAGKDGESAQHFGYRESLRFLLANVIQLVILSALQRSGLPKWLIKGNMNELLVARDEFKLYMSELLAKEKSAFEQGDLNRHNLISALVRAQEQSKETMLASKDSATATATGLSDDEVYGNLFIYNLAGHDTTASTLHFAIVLLAVNPELQEWISEEIDAVRKAESSGIWFYEETFPKLKRCLALMYETVRLHGPVVMMPRYTGDSTQRFAIKNKQYIIPDHTTITLNFAALHTHPDYWGSDALEFRPSRWIVADGKESETEDFFEPFTGSYVPWNTGPRVCPGRKFSQVEFTRVIYSLFANGTRVHLVKEAGESLQDARKRAMQIVNEAKVEVTLKMINAERVGLRWTRKT